MEKDRDNYFLNNLQNEITSQWTFLENISEIIYDIFNRPYKIFTNTFAPHPYLCYFGL